MSTSNQTTSDPKSRTLTESLVDQLEWHWQSHLRPRFDGLTDAEYFAEPVAGCWNVHRRGQSDAPVQAGSGEFTIDFAFPPPVPAPVTTIAWRLWHVIVGVLGMRNASHFGGPPCDYESTDYLGSADATLAVLDEQHDRWIAGIRSLDDEALRRPVGPAEGPFAEAPMIDLVLHIHREVIHHGAEIALLRDLWAHGLPDQRTT